MRYFLLFIIATFNINAYAYEKLDIEFQSLDSQEQSEILCLAQNIYFESVGEPLNGKMAVGMVTMNRVSSDRYPDSVCGVVKQKVKKYCQFSWYCDETKRIKKNQISQSKHFDEILDMSLYIYLRYTSIKDVSQGATHFHATRINPGWHDLKRTVSIGQHVFYKPKQKR